MKFEPPQQWLDEIAAGTEFGKRAQKTIEAIMKSKGAESHYAPRPPAAQVSTIGDRLAKIFNNRVAAVPCGTCVASIRSLNRMTSEQVLENEDKIVAEIMDRAQSAMPTWWKKMLVYVDTTFHIGASERLIRLWLREACVEDTNATVRYPAE